VLTRSRVNSRRRAGLLLALAAVLFLGSIFGVRRQDDGWLLVAGGYTVDVAGAWASGWTRLVRDCRAVPALGPEDPAHTRAAEALRAYSPPDSASARIAAVQSIGVWRLVQASFDALEPVVVIVLDEPSKPPRVLPEAVWSGSPRPFDAGWRIRGFLRSRVPQVPAPLLQCLEPVAGLF